MEQMMGMKKGCLEQSNLEMEWLAGAIKYYRGLLGEELWRLVTRYPLKSINKIFSRIAIQVYQVPAQ